MKILWLTWKDRKNPLAGGAELVNEELAKRLVKDGHEVIFLVAGFKGAEKKEIIDGYKVIRLGNRWTVYWQAFCYYQKNLKNWADLVIDEVNTIPFFAKFYVKEENILFVHQLCRQIWFYEMFFPLNLIGYLIEPIYLWLLKDRLVITISNSSKNDLIKHGFKEERIKIITLGTEIEPVKDLENIEKYNCPTVLSLGSIRPMKNTGRIVKAFEYAKTKIPDLKLIIAGDSNSVYGKKVLDYISQSKNKKDIEYLGRVNQEKKIELMQKCHLICVASIKEGWGLIVTEANSQGTPAVVYNVDGLRDSVKNNITGLICEQNTTADLGMDIVNIFRNKENYPEMRQKAWEWSKEINFEQSHQDFIKYIK